MATSEIKHIAILLPIVWSIRNVVTSSLAERLAAAGVRVTLLPWRADGFESILPSTSGVAIQPLLAPPPGRQIQGSFLLKAISASAFQRYHGMRDQWRTLRKSRRDKDVAGSLRNLLTETLGCAFQPRFLYSQLRRLNAKIYRRENDLTAIYQQLRTLKPDLLCSTACVDGRERPYACAAEELGIRSVASILSFDNLTSRSEIPMFGSYIVWNARMQATLLRIYPQVSQESVFVTGTPQFDFHRRPDFHWSREDTLRHLRLPPGARYVLYAAGHKMFTPTEPDLVVEFAERLAKSADLSDLWVVTRLHPLDDLTRWQGVEASSRKLVISSPWLTPPDENAWALIGPDDQRLLVNSFAHSDLCINMCSTSTLDAAILKRPIIGIAFAKVPGSVEDQFYQEAYRTLHYRPLVESGGLRLAKNWEELLALTRHARESPDSGQEERRLMVSRECGHVDGHSTERVAEAILAVLNDATRPSGRSDRASFR